LCWSCIVFICVSDTLEIALTTLGPFSTDCLCHFQIIFKNVLIIQYALIIGTMSGVKYWYVFVLKNPVGQHDDFWSLYLNSLFFLIASLSQIVFQMLPGKSPYVFYVCSRKFPTPNSTQKINFPKYLAIGISIITYLFVQGRIKFFLSKNPLTAWKMESNLRNTVKTTLANLSNLIVGLISLFPTIIIANTLNNIPFEQFSHPIVLLLIDFQSFIMPPLCLLIVFFAYFSNHKKLKRAMAEKVTTLVPSCSIFRSVEPFICVNY